MRRSHLFSALAVLVSPALAVAESQPVPSEVATEVAPPASIEAPAPAADLAPAVDEVSWDQFDDPDFDPVAAAQSDSPADAGVDSDALQATADASAPAEIELSPTSGPETSHGIVLGPQGVDDQGRSGRLHTVSRGDTLWDLSAAYLGTPWVWPSVWTDNDDIANPHLIMPGDKIWITANEMRVVSDAEAEAFLVPVEVAATGPAGDLATDSTFEDDGTHGPAFEDMAPLAAFDEGDEPSTLDAFPVEMTSPASTSSSGRQITVSRREAMGFVTAEKVAGASTIVDSPSEKVWLSEGDKVYLGMGEGDVEVGDAFTIFEAVEEVRDVHSRRLLGHHVDILGWMEVKQLTGDTSIAEIRTSYAEIERGARAMPREVMPRHVTVQTTPEAIEGEVVFLPSGRTAIADGGYVYLNRGELHGVEVGSELEVYDGGAIRTEATRGVDVQTPTRSIATLVVVSVEPDSSVAFVLSASRELIVGDTVRPAIPKLALR